MLLVAALLQASALHVVAALGGNVQRSLRASEVTVSPYPIDDAEHVECSHSASGCTPAGGCESSLDRWCFPLVGHYWSIGEFTRPWYVPRWLATVLPSSAPRYRIMTEKGVLEAKPGFWLTTYELLVACAACPTRARTLDPAA